MVIGGIELRKTPQQHSAICNVWLMANCVMIGGQTMVRTEKKPRGNNERNDDAILIRKIDYTLF